MLLAIDIGNTNINFGIFKGNRILKRFFVPTKSYSLKNIKKNLSTVQINAIIICSVVPDLNRILKRDLTGLLGRKPYIIGKDIKVPIKNLYRRPKQVGQDRLVNAYAGAMFYGAPLIVVDFGTAISFDALSKNSEYLGGIILPGLELSLDALYKNTALLPQLKLNTPKEVIGKDTKNSILSGIVYGFAAVTDEFAKKIKSKIGKNAKVIGTGGNIAFIGKYCSCFDNIDKDLTLKGINLVYNNSKKKGFTLLELIVVIVIIGVLATLGFTQYNKITEKGRTAEARMILGTISTLQGAYYLENGQYATALSQLPVSAPTSCTSTHYFTYSIGDSGASAFASRCGSGGKTPDYPSCPYHCRTGNSYTRIWCGVWNGSAWTEYW